MSLDGFIAGPDDDLSWLPWPDVGFEDTFTPFLADIGAILMGRRTYEVVESFDESWPYGDLPILVATRRPLESERETVRAVGGDIAAQLEEARRMAGDGDIYVDGGGVIRSALDADLIDEVTLTVVPVVLGAGISLFAGAKERRRFFLNSSREIGGGLVQLSYRTR